MPIHDWSIVRVGVFHDFHQAWSIEIYKALNHGILPPGYFALAKQVTGLPNPDGDGYAAYVDSVAVGDKLPSAPVFLEAERYVTVPLEETSMATWSDLPGPVRQLFA